MSDWQRVEDPVDRLHGFASGFHAAYYVYVGVESGLFEALVEARPPDDLAGRLDLHPPYVRRFCEVGLRFGLLVVETECEAPRSARYRLHDDFVEPLATTDSPRYMGDLFRYLGDHASEDYRATPEALADGTQRSFASRDAAFTEVIEGMTRGLQEIFLEALVPELSAFVSRLESGGRILDVGCGTGYLACELAARYPDVEVTGLDLDEDAIERARERANRESVADRTRFRAQDATDVDGTYDGAVFFMSLHEVDETVRRALFDRLGDVLADDGVVAVFDEVYPERYDEFGRNPYAAGAETQWAELTWGNDVPTESEQRDLLAVAGCEERARQTFAERFVVYEGVNT